MAAMVSLWGALWRQWPHGKRQWCATGAAAQRVPPLPFRTPSAPTARWSSTALAAAPDVDLPVLLAAGAVLAASVGGLAFEAANAEPAAAPRGTALPGAGRRYTVGLVPFFLLVPFFSRPTYRYTIVPDRIWGFEQKQGIGLGLNTAVSVRMTVVRLTDGGLWVHAPIAATAECIALVRELEAVHGPVRYIVLPTTLLEHKLWVGPFARRFPDAQTFVVEGQYSYPIDAPLPVFSGIFAAGAITADNPGTLPWAGELDHTLFDPPPITPLGDAVRFTEAAFFHRPTRTLLVTDTLVYVEDDPPDVITRRDCLESGDDGNFALTALRLLGLFGTREAAVVRAQRLDGREVPESERITLGWRRNALTALYFGYSNAFDPEASWRGIAGRVVVPPVVGVFVYENAPEAALGYADRICRWDFRRIIPGHFSVAAAGPSAVRAAFDWLRPRRPRGWPFPANPAAPPWPEGDARLLRNVEAALTSANVIYPNSTTQSSTD